MGRICRAQEAGTMRDANLKEVVFFCLKFLIFLLPLVAFWWYLALPWYGELLKQISGSILKYAFGANITSGDIQLKGLMNTESVLSFTIGNHEPAMPIVKLVSNIPPYLALVFATPGIAAIRRIKVTLYGLGILFFFHAGFIVFALRIQSYNVDYSKIPMALGQFMITLPFLLWIIFAYWDKIQIAITGQKNKKRTKV